MAAFALLAFATAALAQDAAKQKEEADAYKAWYDANGAKDFPKAYDLAKTYLEKFASGQYAEYLKKWVVQTRGYLFGVARQAKNINDEIRLGEEALAVNADDLDYLYLLAVDIRTAELFAATPNYSHEAKGVDYTQRSIRLIESGKVPNVVDKQKWNQNQTLAYLYQTLAVLEQKNKNNEKALELYKKCASLDPTAPNYFFQVGSLHYEKYSVAVKKFEALPAEKKQQPENDPEAKSALDDLNNQADAVIEAWARFVALTKNNQGAAQTRDQIEKAATELYKFRHPDSPTGFQDLVNKYATGAPPTN